MKTKVFLVLVVLAGLFILSPNAQAVLQRVTFDAWTQDEPNPGKRLCVALHFKDDEFAHPPDYIKAIRITAPDGSVFFLDLSKDWMPWDPSYYRGFGPADFKGQVIPNGTYTVKVIPEVGNAISQTDVVKNTFLPIPVLTYPTEGLTDVPETPVITWEPVTGATSYEIRLFNVSWQEYVYYYPDKKFPGYTSYEMPRGMLKPNCNYRIQILARAGGQDMDMRSRTAWINFRTGSW